jgi:hypothetical protein
VTAANNVVALPASTDELLLVKPGDYAAVYVRHQGANLFGTVKLRVDFRLVDHLDLVLPRWYRVQNYAGGRIRAGRHSDIVRELSAALNRRLRCDRIPVGELANKIVSVRVRTVTKDARQGDLAGVNRYSVIDKVLETVQ